MISFQVLFFNDRCTSHTEDSMDVDTNFNFYFGTITIRLRINILNSEAPLRKKELESVHEPHILTHAIYLFINLPYLRGWQTMQIYNHILIDMLLLTNYLKIKKKKLSMRLRKVKLTPNHQ